MTPIAVREYLAERKMATLHEIATHFQKETGTVTPMLDLWVGKGKVKKHDENLGCQKGCCQCNSASIVVYEWLATN